MKGGSEGARLIEALRNRAAYSHETGAIRVIETHISWILLTGDYAYKIKKPVDFGFLDFSTLERRRHFCEEEVRLNRRFAPDIYLDVVRITASDGGPQVGGSGKAIEYAVRMRQFDADGLLSTRADAGRLDAADIDALADVIGHFHRQAVAADPVWPYGEAGDIRHWSEENFDHIEPLVEEVTLRHRIHAIKAWTREAWQHLNPLMRERKQQGYVRECHGDLHLGNIALVDDRITPFDCIEFNPLLRWIDVMNELAFILMDLLQRRLDSHYWRLLNRYLQYTGDYGGLALLRYYIVYRAMVRVKVALLSPRDEKDPQAEARCREAILSHTRLAERCIRPMQPMLMLTHGYSGSGKSHFSTRLAEEEGAIHLRSDIERKRLFGLEAGDSSGSGLGSGIYSAHASRKTYFQLAEVAERVLDAGFDVVVDAAFLQREQRALFLKLAQKRDVPLMIFDYRADAAVLSDRIQSRAQDPSEATTEVLRQQMETAEPIDENEKARVVTIDTMQADAWSQIRLAIDACRKRLNR